MSIKMNKTKALALPDERIIVQAFWMLTFAILTAISAQIRIPNQPVPYTMQTFFVFLAGALLGKGRGMISMGMYLLLGAAGLPVFSGGGSGFSGMFGTTGGYLLAFPLAAFAIGFLIKIRQEFWWMIISVSVGSLIIFSLGTIYLNMLFVHNWVLAVQAGFLIFSWWDALKILSAAAIAYQYFRRAARNPV
ncbi:MAG: biotin transporter BioY [Bacteroidetes bacterium]|nr:biotin transporter BioY [Bacteroidota bacterium]